MHQQAAPTDYYEVLGISRSAGPDEIKRAYRREAKRYHSDVTRGGDERMRALNEAYAVLTRPSQRWAAPHDDEERRGPPVPYLTPSVVNWTATEAESPQPVTVRLSNRGGPVSTIEPDRMGGAFWMIEETAGVMTGEDLADVVFAPVGSDSLPVGTHVDEVIFWFDGQPAKLAVVMAVAFRSTPAPPDPEPAPPPPPSPPPRPARRSRDGAVGAFSALAFVLLLAIVAAVTATAANDRKAAPAAPASVAVPSREPATKGISHVQGHGLIRQGGEQQPQWEVLGVDVTASRGSFSVDFGGSQAGGLESSCVYVNGTKVFPTTVSGNRYLQASPKFRSQVERGTLGPGLEHRHSYTVTFPYYGAGRYEFVYGCSTDFSPAVELFTRTDTSRSPTAAAVRGPLYADGVLVVARNVNNPGDRVKLGPIDLFDGGLVVNYERAGSKERYDVHGRSCLRGRRGIVASPAGPNQRNLLLATRDNTDIPAAVRPYELQFMCGGYEPALPVSGRLFTG